MGTRNITVVKLDGETRVSQYGQFDGYPTYSGVVMLEFATEPKRVGELAYRIALNEINFITKEQAENVVKALEGLPEDIVDILSVKSPLMREWGVGILSLLTHGPLRAYLVEEDAVEPDSDIEGIYTLEIDSKGLDRMDIHRHPERMDYKVHMRYHGVERSYDMEDILSMTAEDIERRMKEFQDEADER